MDTNTKYRIICLYDYTIVNSYATKELAELAKKRLNGKGIKCQHEHIIIEVKDD